VLSFRLLVYHGSGGPPSLHLVTARAADEAVDVADELLTGSPGAVGVELWRGEQRLYARGVTPAGAGLRADDQREPNGPSPTPPTGPTKDSGEAD